MPATLTLDHTATAPANQTVYAIGERVLQGNCAIPASLLGVVSLSVSDPIHVQVTSSPNRRQTGRGRSLRET